MIIDYHNKKLSRLSGSKIPQRWLFFDTETKSRPVYDNDSDRLLTGWDAFLYKDDFKGCQKLRMKLCWTMFARYDKQSGFVGDSWKFFTDTKRLWEYIVTLPVKGSPLYLIAHNIFFDLQCSDFFYWLTKAGWVLQFLYDKGLTYILSIRKGDLVIKCLSSTNFFPFGLKKLGETVGVSKIEIDFDKATRTQLIDYCRTDVKILKVAMQYYLSLLQTSDLGSFKLTRGSQAFNAYRYRFMAKDIFLHKHDEVTTLEQSGYFGGRVEARFLGQCKGRSFIHLDVNSLYPFIMRNCFVPVRLVRHKTCGSADEIKKLLKYYCIMADVNLKTDEPAYPYRYKGKLTFPVGSFTTTLCSEGLSYALKAGHIESVGFHAIYDKAKIFTDYVDYWHGMRKKYAKSDNKVMVEIAKNFLNFLYGKFAQQKDIVEMYDDITYDGYFREEVFDLVTRKTEVTTKLFNRVFRTFDRQPSNIYFCGIAAHITESARFYLYKLMKMAGLPNVLYCDTDSLKLQAKYLPVYKKMIHPTRLGALKLEGTSKALSIFGAKYYVTESSRRIKGVPAKAECIGEYRYEYTQFFRQAKHLRNQITRFMTIKKVTKTVAPFYDKGTVLADGRIIPLEF